jgi:hypothetical protein
MKSHNITNRDICDLLRNLECELLFAAEELEKTSPSLAEEKYKSAYRARRMYEQLSRNPLARRKHGWRLFKVRFMGILPDRYRYLRHQNGRVKSALGAVQFAFLRR